MAQPGPTKRPRRTTVSNEISAAKKFGTQNRSQTPIVSGTRKNASKASVCAGLRLSAKNSRRNVVTRASTLATEAMTPSFTSSVIRIRLALTTPSLYRATRGQGEKHGYSLMRIRMGSWEICGEADGWTSGPVPVRSKPMRRRAPMRRASRASCRPQFRHSPWHEPQLSPTP